MTETVTSEKTAAQINAQMRIKYALTGMLDRSLDQRALKVYFQEDINKRTQFFHSQSEKLRYLIDNNYYESEFLEKYNQQDVLDLYQSLYDRKFRFQTYIAAQVFYSSYALKSFDGKYILERYEDRVGTVALYLADGDIELARKFANDMIRGIYQPATPTFQNSGKKSRGELVSCFIVYLSDTLNSIQATIGAVGSLSKIGGGVGYCATNVRGRGAPVKGYKDRSKGIVPIAKQVEMRAIYVDQLGTRPGQVAMYVSALHYDVMELLRARRAIDDSDVSMRLTDLNIGLMVPDIVYQLAAEGKDMAMFCPYDVKRVAGKPMSEISMTEWYWTLYNDESVRRKYISAEEFWNEVSALQGECGYPYIINEDRVNELNPVYGRISSSNLCSEIMQPHELSDIGDGFEWKHVGRDVSCNLGSCNIAKLFEYGSEIESTIENSMRSLTQVSLFSNIRAVKSIVRGNAESHAVGLGIMNYHGFLVSEGIEYGSDLSITFTDWFFMSLRYYALKASNKFAIERGETFVDFDKSKYATGEALLDYTSGKYDHVPEEIAGIFDRHGFKVPTTEMWVELNASIMKHGLFNRNHLAVAPTGSISYISNSTASIAPITAHIEGRQASNIGTVYFPMPYLTDDNKHLYTTGYDMSYERMFKLYGAATVHVDQGISCTQYAKHSATISYLNGMRNVAWREGLKSLYYVRFENNGDDPTSENSTIKMEMGDDRGFKECEACGV